MVSRQYSLYTYTLFSGQEKISNMGAGASTPVEQPLKGAASSYPTECPMHQKEQAHSNGCPMNKDDHDINPANMVNNNRTLTFVLWYHTDMYILKNIKILSTIQ